MKRRKESLVFGIVVLILFLGVGYAYLTTTLTINGTADVDSNNWNVYFDNINVTIGSVTGEQVIETPTITGNTTVGFHIRLKKPRDFYEFTIDAKNDGTLDAMIESITKNINGGTTIPPYLIYTVTYEEGDEIENNHILAAGSLETYRIRIEYRNDVAASDLPSTDQSLTLSFGVSYIQATSSAQEVIHPEYVYTANLRDDVEIVIGQAIPSEVMQYSSAEDAMSALNATIHSNLNVCLKHRIENGIVTESYVVFKITPEDSTEHPEMIPGTYFLRGTGATYNSSTHSYNEDSIYYESNKVTSYRAYGDFCTDWSNYLECWGDFYVYPDGLVSVGSMWNCTIDQYGHSYCRDEW